MFFHNVKYSLKTLLKNKGLLFWTFAFPLILATFFNMAFGNWEESEKFDPIKIAIIDNSYYQSNEVAKNVFNSISKDDDNQVFEIVYTSYDKASKLLDNKKIVGFIEYSDKNTKVKVDSNSISSTIIKSVVSEIDTYNVMFDDLMNYELSKTDYSNIDMIVNSIVDKISNQKIETNDISVYKLDISVIEYYSLLAMTCLYGGIIAMTCLNNSLASSSDKGKRVGVSPVKKSVIFLSSLLASFIVQMLGVLLLLCYLNIIGVNLHADILSVILVIILGVLAGIALGLVITVLVNKNESTKTGVIIAVSMACSVLAGLTGVSLKYVIDSNLPIINKINPSAMITDGLYALYYNDGSRFISDIISLIIFIFVIAVISIFSLRRKKYDSI